MDRDLKSIFYAFIIIGSFFRGHGTINELLVSVTATKSKISDSNHSPRITTSDIISKKNYFVLGGVGGGSVLLESDGGLCFRVVGVLLSKIEIVF
jgi:hypothetical protein